jgi:Mg-chelatase subunit ChlD
MVDHLLGDDKAPQSLKIEGMRAAVQGGAPVVAALQRAVARVKKQDDLVAFLLAVQMVGPPAKPMADPIVKLVDHADATVREHAALALAQIGAPQGIEPLIKRLEKEEGRTQLRIAAALEILTKQTLGASPNAWKSWFAAEGIKYTSGQVPLGGGKAQVTEKANGYFHGIAQDSRSIVYVVDVSGSMVVSLKDPKFEDPQQTRPIAAGPGEESRMSCSKKELIKALGDLPPGTKFDIVTFSTTAERYSPKLIEASPAAIKKAQKFVEELEPVGATNIYDAMESAFGLAGRGSADKFYDSGVDTIFLLTDGQPMLYGSRERDSTQRIEDAVKRMNPFKRITVHTIGLGNGIDADFLKRLAADNGGTFVQR